ncbi:MAG: hypothetical protein Q4B68_11275, partial [Bacteroidales bacterium]|nr:hypothetical protein [Bacteroidales bacterium]
SGAGICPNKFERAKGSLRLCFIPLRSISQRLRCIPAYTHPIPKGIAQPPLNLSTKSNIKHLNSPHEKSTVPFSSRGWGGVVAGIFAKMWLCYGYC